MAIVTAFDIAKQHYEAEIEQLTRDLEDKTLTVAILSGNERALRSDLEAARAERDRENLDHLEYVVAKTAQTDRLQRENERLTEALRRINQEQLNGQDPLSMQNALDAIEIIAREALVAKA